ncbi:MAG: hypothetical protein IJ048_01815, partial [Clostridia bacterium]|nr:hypothetical protein [Clostridia bacterium]
MRREKTAQMRGAAALGSLALVFHVFTLEVVDLPGSCAAGWLSTAAGAVLALPVALCLAPKGKDGDSAPFRRV